MDGVVTDEGALPLTSVPARGSVTIPAPWQIPAQPGRVDVRLIYTAARDNGFVKAGDTLGFDQLTLRQMVPALPALQPGRVNCRETEEKILVEGDDFAYTFDRFTGCFKSMVWQGREQLSRPMGFNVWRAPTDNDRKIRRVWEEAGYDRAQTRVEHCRAESGQPARISCDVTLASVIRQPFLRCRVLWEIDAAGDLRLTVDGRRDMVFPFLPRFGVRLFLTPGFEQLAYTGYGPAGSVIWTSTAPPGTVDSPAPSPMSMWTISSPRSTAVMRDAPLCSCKMMIRCSGPGEKSPSVSGRPITPRKCLPRLPMTLS